MASETTPSQTARDITAPVETEQQHHVPVPPTTAAGPSTEIDTRTHPQEASEPPSDVSADQIKKQSDVSVVELPPRSPTFKEQVYGYARLIRGTVLGQPGVKEQGTHVLRGEQSIPLRRGSQSNK